MRHAVAVIDKI